MILICLRCLTRENASRIYDTIEILCTQGVLCYIFKVKIKARSVMKHLEVIFNILTSYPVEKV
ncbi:unnamed protein product [Larinioides sclopetarius]|uniref:Uncharacterized protein n=1 Tax=Larinioides sclopetarius TaxID=280406 RepID=A0AAV2B3E6_9ARAC